MLLLVQIAALIAPSILAADFGHLADEVQRIEDSADLLHLDVMDGHFVPNISLGVPVIAGLRVATDLKFDCHLMMNNADSYFEAFRTAGADLVTVHIEVYPDPIPVVAKARDLGLQFGLAINPATAFEAVAPYVELTDMLLVMSVEPGFGGQAFDETSLEKIEAARKFVESHGLSTDIEVDGGIGPENISRVRDAGANVFVAGSSVFKAGNPGDAVAALRSALERHETP